MDREKLIRETIERFKDQEDLHQAYKNRMKGILLLAIAEVIGHVVSLKEGDPFDIEEWVDKYVEENTKGSKDEK